MRKPRPPRVAPRLDPEVLDDITKEWVVQCGMRVRARRDLLKLHARELADLAGVSEPTIIRIEAGSLNPRDGIRIAIAAALRCEVAELWEYPSHRQIDSRAKAVA